MFLRNDYKALPTAMFLDFKKCTDSSFTLPINALGIHSRIWAGFLKVEIITCLKDISFIWE